MALMFSSATNAIKPEMIYHVPPLISPGSANRHCCRTSHRIRNAMTRNRATAKKAGSSFERLMADYLASQMNDDRIDRRVKNGAKDRGDIGGVKHRGLRVVLECKNAGGRFEVGSWLTEAEVERGNDDAGICCVLAKRRATTDPGDQVVIMTMRDLIALLTGERPAEAGAAA